MGAPRKIWEIVWTPQKTSCSMHSRSILRRISESPISSWSLILTPFGDRIALGPMPFEQLDLGDLLLLQPLVAAANGSPSRQRGVQCRPAGKRGRWSPQDRPISTNCRYGWYGEQIRHRMVKTRTSCSYCWWNLPLCSYLILIVSPSNRGNPSNKGRNWNDINRSKNYDGQVALSNCLKISKKKSMDFMNKSELSWVIHFHWVIYSTYIFHIYPSYIWLYIYIHVLHLFRNRIFIGFSSDFTQLLCPRATKSMLQATTPPLLGHRHRTGGSSTHIVTYIYIYP